MAASPIPIFDDEVEEVFKRTKWRYKVSYCRSCVHRDCAEARAFRNRPCGMCGKLWQPEDYAYNDDKFGWVHKECLDN